MKFQANSSKLQEPKPKSNQGEPENLIDAWERFLIRAPADLALFAWPSAGEWIFLWLVKMFPGVAPSPPDPGTREFTIHE